MKVLTKYQLEKKIRWYHWEVVDASCCSCAHMIDDTSSDDSAAGSADDPALVKPAPPAAKVGESIPVSKKERKKLAALFNLDENEIQSEPLIASAAE